MNTTTRIRRTLRRFVKHERGSQLIELSFAVPFLLVRFAGTVEVGRLFYTYTTLAKGTEVGARYLSTVQADLSTGVYADDDIEDAQNLVICGNAAGCGGTGQPAAIVAGLNDTKISVDPPGNTVGPRYVTVSITALTYQPAVFNLGAMTNNKVSINVPLTPSTKMRYMRN